MRIILYFSLMATCFGCGNAPNTTASSAASIADTAGLSEPLYPFPQYLAAQIAYVDSTPFAIEKISYTNGTLTDSGFISHSEFLQLASVFTQIDPNSNAVRRFYRETSFNDLTLDALTFNISAQNPDLLLQEATILLQPETKAVKNVFMKTNQLAGDSSISQTLLWVHNKNFSIAKTIAYYNNRTTQTIKVIWDRP